MSTDDKSTPPTVWLTVSFDADQLGSQLIWAATEGRENLYQTYGPFAGSLSLPKNCLMRVEVRGYGGRNLAGFEVQSAGLITVPVAPDLSPSPFTGQLAAITLVSDFSPTDGVVFDPHIDRAYAISANGTPLVIGNEDGAWHLSMALTVSIRTLAPDGTIVSSRRVFRFDPESYVGNGTRPG